MNKFSPQALFEQLRKNCTHNNAEKIDGIYLQKKENIQYLTGFSGSFGRILLSEKKSFLISDSRYSESAKRFAATAGFEYREIQSGSKGKNFWKHLETEAEISHLGFESHCSYQEFEQLEKIFESPLFPLSKGIEHFRLQKSETEISCLQKAAEIGDKALERVVENFRVGVSEKELAMIFEFEARKFLGAQSLSFDTIVAFGENSAIPHHSPTGKKLKKNMPILIDCGVKFSDYCSDMTRCFWFGEQTGPLFEEWKNCYQKVALTQQVGREKIQIGNEIAIPEISARKFLGSEEQYFSHTFGHGVGLEIHEAPTLSERTPKDQKFLENMIVTAEPGLYFSGKFGIRIEDLLVVRKNGAEPLSHFPYFFKE